MAGQLITFLDIWEDSVGRCTFGFVTMAPSLLNGREWVKYNNGKRYVFRLDIQLSMKKLLIK